MKFITKDRILFQIFIKKFTFYINWYLIAALFVYELYYQRIHFIPNLHKKFTFYINWSLIVAFFVYEIHDKS